ncbi:MAG: hypothetical protein NT164_03965 [Verrucomicrobiae bacterium]|nr:hypothetical protein [Verrucomicrobiae bacterium]
MSSICSVAAAAMLLDSGASVLGNCHDLLHPNFLAGDEAELVGLVPAPADLDLEAIASSYFAVVAVGPDGFGGSLGYIDLDSMHPNFLVGASVDFLDFPEPAAIYLAEAVAALLHFAVSAVDIDCDLGCSNPSVDEAVVLLPFLAVAARRG